MLKEYTLKATIPTGSYANIQPEITVEAESLEEAHAIVMPHIKGLFQQYSDMPLRGQGVVQVLKSFNEDVEIEFDKVSHTYTFNGKLLESGSTFAGKHVKPFDKEPISKTCAKAWGVPQADILELWESNGNVASDFGTAVHAALEHYFKRRGLGETIKNAAKKKDVNAALPNHPLLQRIILELEKLDTEIGIERQEVLVSNVNRGYCGMVDKLKILDEAKKICRVQDYKIAYDVDKDGEKLLAPFAELPPTKLSKYQIQLSFYANLLALSGWTVTGLDIFAYGDEWKKYELEILQVIQ